MNAKKAADQVAVLKCFTASGDMFVTLAEGADRSKLITKPNIVRVEDGQMSVAEFNAIPGTIAAATFFSEQGYRAERAPDSMIEIAE